MSTVLKLRTLALLRKVAFDSKIYKSSYLSLLIQCGICQECKVILEAFIRYDS